MEETERPEGRGAAKEKEEKGTELFYMLQSLGIAVSAMILLFTFVVRVNQVKGHSMDNTLQPQELLLVWHLGYTPKAGDIVIVNRPNVDILEGEAIVKRVIAVGGQTVDIDYGAGIVYVDGVPLYQRDHVSARQPLYAADPLRHPGGVGLRHGGQPEQLHRQPERGRGPRGGAVHPGPRGAGPVAPVQGRYTLRRRKPAPDAASMRRGLCIRETLWKDRAASGGTA